MKERECDGFTANDHESAATGTTPLAAGSTTAAPARATGRHAVTSDGCAPAGAPRAATAIRYLLAGIRFALGWIFLWALLDNLFGLGHDTASAQAWINGDSPTAGFLGKAAVGPFTSLYHSLAGNPIVDVLFVAALLAIGTALLLGIAMRIAAAGGAVLMVLMWTAVLPPANNPSMDDHLVYAGVLILLALLGAGTTPGLGRAWAATPLVRRYTWPT
ncbi:MAG TPA: hypothetical protein VFW27_05125 [Actinoplanes sp.]|nr:hypothetical protein [Actinoplanes sp.]